MEIFCIVWSVEWWGLNNISIICCQRKRLFLVAQRLIRNSWNLMVPDRFKPLNRQNSTSNIYSAIKWAAAAPFAICCVFGKGFRNVEKVSYRLFCFLFFLFTLVFFFRKWKRNEVKMSLFLFFVQNLSSPLFLLHLKTLRWFWRIILSKIRDYCILRRFCTFSLHADINFIFWKCCNFSVDVP